MIIPAPNGTEVMPELAQNIFTVLAGVPMVVVFFIALNLALRKKDPLLLYCFIGGGLAAFFEPVADILCKLNFPAVNQNSAFTTFDRPIPWALVFAYPWYIGGQGYLTCRVLENGATAGKIWILWSLFILSDIVIETPGVLTGFHYYYGNQPYNFWGFPLWMASYQSVMPLIAGALIYVTKKYIGSGWKMLCVIALMPMADALTNAGLALPIWSTLSTDLPLSAQYLAATVTMGLAAMSVWLLTLIFASDSHGSHQAA